MSGRVSHGHGNYNYFRILFLSISSSHAHVQDQTILATATPTISDEFKALDDVGWWTAIYLFTLSTFQLFYGKLYMLFSIKIVYLCAIAIFELGSLICATAPNAVALTCGRAIAGLGAAGIFSGGIMVTTKVIPLDHRAAYLGIMSGVFGVAAIVGPFIGGALTEKSTWRWCFGINLPMGFVTIVICSFLVRTPTNPLVRTMGLREKLRQFDLVGMVLLIAALVCLLLGLQWGGSTYPWSNGRVIALLVVAGVLMIGFILVQVLGKSSKTIPPTLARSRSIWLAISYAMCMTGGVYVAILYVPIWFQAIQHQSVLSSGVMLMPLIVGYVVCSVIAGILTSVIGYYNPAMIIGTILAVIGAGLLTTLTPQTARSAWIGYQLLYGLGVGFGFGQPSYVVQTLLPEKEIPIGVTLVTLVQNLSATIFVAVGQSIFQNTLADRLHDIAPGVSASSLMQSGATQLASMFTPEQMPQVLDAYSAALVRTMYISLGLSCLSTVGAVLTEWKSMKVKSRDDRPLPGVSGEKTR